MPVPKSFKVNKSVQQVNGFYIHSSPPRVLQVHSSIIRQWIRGGDLDQLEQLVLNGQGQKLVGEYSTDPKVRNFLKRIPAFLVKSRKLHDAVTKGNLKQFQKLLSKTNSQEPPLKNIHLSKNKGGLSLLHKAVYYGHPQIVEFLVTNFPNSVNMKDNDGKTPLFYCGASAEAGKIWPMLVKAGADATITDSKGKRPAYYMERWNEIQLPDEKILSGISLGSSSDKNNILIKPSNIRIWIHDRDLKKLQKVIWEGHGAKLRVETSKHPKVKRFLEGVPYILNIIKDVHALVLNNDYETFVKKTSDPVPPEVLGSKDINGLTPLHKAAGLNRREIAENILKRNPNLVFSVDREGKTPLHYSAVLKEQSTMYSLLMENYADETATDQNGKTASYYRVNPKELNVKLLEVIPEAPRISATFPQTFEWSLFRSDNLIPSENSLTIKNSQIKMQQKNHEENKPRVKHGADSGNEDLESKQSEDKRLVAESENLMSMRKQNYVKEPEKNKTYDIWTNDEDGNDQDQYGDSDNKEALQEDSEEAVQEDNGEAVQEDNGEVGQEDNEEAVQEDKEEAVQEDNGEAVQEDNEEAVQEDNGEEVQEDNEEAVQEDNEEAVQKDNGEVVQSVNMEDRGIAYQMDESSAGPKKEESNFGEKKDAEDVTESIVPAAEIEMREKTEREIAEERQRLLDEGLLKINADEEEADNEDKKLDEVVEMGDMEKLAAMVLNGEGNKIVGKQSSNPEVQSFLNNVPIYMSKITAVHTAARNGSLKDLQAALDRRKFAVAKESLDKLGATPLHVAVVFENSPIVKYLGGRFSETLISKDKLGRTPLHYSAVLQDDGQIYATLLNLGADPNIKDDEGNTAAFYQNNPGKFTRESLIKEMNFPSQVIREQLNNEGVSSPVADPSIHNEEPEVSFDEGIPLSKKTVNEDAEEGNNDNGLQPSFSVADRDDYGQSVLHFAAARAHGRGGLFQLIHESGVNLGFRDELYRTARDIAQQANIPENVNEIDKYVISLAAKGETEKLMELFLEGYDHILDLEDDEDNDIITIVTNKNHEKTLAFLKAIPTLEEKRERIHRAIRAGDDKAVEGMISESKNGRILIIGKNTSGRCSLHIAILCQKKDITEFIAQKFPESLKIGDNIERTPLHYAMGVEEVEKLSKILIKCGAKRVVKDLKGRQPTYYFMNRTEILKLQEEENVLRV